MCWKQKRGIRSQGRFAHVVTFIRKVHFDSPLVLKSTRGREILGKRKYTLILLPFLLSFSNYTREREREREIVRWRKKFPSIQVGVKERWGRNLESSHCNSSKANKRKRKEQRNVNKDLENQRKKEMEKKRRKRGERRRCINSWYTHRTWESISYESEDFLPGTHSDSSLTLFLPLNSFFLLFSFSLSLSFFLSILFSFFSLSPDVSRFISKFVWSSKIP